MKRSSIATSAVLVAALGLVATACGTQSATPVTTDGEGPAVIDSAAADSAAIDPAADSAVTQAPPIGGSADTGPATADRSSGERGSLRSALLADTIDRSDAMSSARFEARIDLVGTAGSELPGPVAISFAGAYDVRNDASEMTIDFGDLFALAVEAGDENGAEIEGMDELADAFAESFSQPIQVITIGDRSWIKSGLLALFGIEGDKWLEGDGQDRADLSTSMGPGGAGSPTELLEILADADAAVEVVATEELRGVATTHYRAGLDLAALAGRLDGADREALETELGAPVGAGYAVDLWIDDDDRLHRMTMRIDEIPPGTDNDGLESMAIAYDLWDHGLDQGIVPPPADQTLTEEELGFDVGDLSGFGAAG